MTLKQWKYWRNSVNYGPDTDTDMTDQSDSEGFVDVLMELEDKAKQLENKDSKGNVSSNGNSWVNEFIFIVFNEAFARIYAFSDDGSQQSSSDTTAEEKQYFSSDEECKLVWHS